MKYNFLNFLANICNPLWVKLPLYVKIKLLNKKLITGKMKFKDQFVLCQINSVESYFRLSSFYKEPNMLVWFENYFKDNDVFYDIGANVGSYSLISQKLFNNKLKTIAFEPSFSTYSNLCTNVILNKMEDVIKPLNLLLSSSNSVVNLQYSNINAGSAGHNVNKSNEKNKSFEQCMYAYPLDQVVLDFNLPLPNHIKIDVDGNELDVLKGMNKVLNYEELRSIQIEFDDNFEDQYTDILEILKAKKFILAKSFLHKNSKVKDTIYIKAQ